MWIAGTSIYYEDGSSSVLLHPDTGLSGAACTCMTREEWEAEGWKEELNSKALEICEELVALNEDVVSNECQEDYESGRWFSFTFWNAEGVEPSAMWDPGCIGE